MPNWCTHEYKATQASKYALVHATHIQKFNDPFRESKKQVGVSKTIAMQEFKQNLAPNSITFPSLLAHITSINSEYQIA